MQSTRTIRTNMPTMAPGRFWVCSVARAAIILSAVLAFVSAAQAAAITRGPATGVEPTNPSGTILNSSSGQYSEYIDAVTCAPIDHTVNGVSFHAFTSTATGPSGWSHSGGMIAYTCPAAGPGGNDFVQAGGPPTTAYGLAVGYSTYSGDSGSIELSDPTTFGEAVTEVSPASASGMPALDSGWSYRTFRLNGDVPPRGSKGFLHVKVASSR